MSEFAKKVKDLVKVGGLVGALVVTGCSTGGGTSRSTNSIESPATTPNAGDRSPSVLPQGEQAIRERMNQLWQQGTAAVRAQYEKDGTLNVAMGACVGWNSNGGYTVVANPAYYEFKTPTEKFSFVVFASAQTDKSLSPAKGLTLMNGPFEYTQLDDSGNFLPETHYGLDLDLKGDLETAQVTTASTIYDGNEWVLRAGVTGTPLLTTRILPEFSQAEFDNFCATTTPH